MLKISISNNDFQYLLNETQISLPEYLNLYYIVVQLMHFQLNLFQDTY